YARRREILALQLRGDLLQLVEARRRLPRRRSAGDELPHVLLDIVERRAILAARPDVRQALGQLGEGAIDAGRVAAGDDERALLAERFLDDLNQPFARLER